MDDLISRQAAIDAAIEATDSWEGFCSIGRQKRIENYINSLPFAPGMDLISRRAAIDICANVIDLFREQFGAGVLVAIKESIEELPSALGTNLAEVGTDTISRQAAINKILGQPPEPHYPSWYAEQIKELPPAEPKRMRGYWTPRDFNKRNGNISTCAYYFPTCSICRNVGDERFAFCPNCGADMRGERNE